MILFANYFKIELNSYLCPSTTVEVGKCETSRDPDGDGTYENCVVCNLQADGAWNNYPYLPSGNILVTDQLNGLFILRATPPYDAPAPPQSVTAERVAPNNHVSLSWNAVLNARGYTVERSFDGSSYSVIAEHLISTSYVDSDASRQDAYYIVKATNAEGSGASFVTSPKCVSYQD